MLSRRSCYQQAQPRVNTYPHSAVGFTLLELLVVLVIMALAAAVVAPNYQRLLSQLQSGEALEQALERFAQQNQLAQRQRREHQWQPDPEQGNHWHSFDELLAPEAAPDLQGWQWRPIDPLRITRQGVCLGGRIEVQYQQATPRLYQIQTPWCRLEALPSP